MKPVTVVVLMRDEPIVDSVWLDVLKACEYVEAMNKRLDEENRLKAGYGWGRAEYYQVYGPVKVMDEMPLDTAEKIK